MPSAFLSFLSYWSFAAYLYVGNLIMPTEWRWSRDQQVGVGFVLVEATHTIWHDATSRNLGALMQVNTRVVMVQSCHLLMCISRFRLTRSSLHWIHKATQMHRIVWLCRVNVETSRRACGFQLAFPRRASSTGQGLTMQAQPRPIMLC